MVCKLSLKAASEEELLGMTVLFSRLLKGTELGVKSPGLVFITDICLSTNCVPNTGMIEYSSTIMV